MNEINETFFQIKPKESYFPIYGRYVMFMNECFNLDDIKFVSAVEMAAVQHYRFHVHIGMYNENKKVTYEFTTKSGALKAQRELARAWTHTGEFEYVESTDDTKRTGSPVGGAEG